MPKLEDIQVIGRDFLADRQAAILADEVGSGKTVQALAAIDLLPVDKVLYVTGAQAGFQVEDEVGIWCPMSTCRRIAGPKSQRKQMYHHPPRISVITYGVLRSDKDILKLIDWDLIIIDDASKVKNPKSKLSIAAWEVSRSIAQRGGRRWAMTASPIETALTDLWAIFHAIFHYPLGTYETFNSAFCEWQYRWGRQEIVGYRNLELLRERLEGHILRRTLIGGPELQQITHRLGIYPEQARIYRLARSGHFGNSVHDRFTRCLMACDSTAFEQSVGAVSSKVDTVTDILKSLDTEKFVVYSRWKKVIYQLQNRFNSERIPYVTISGDVPLAIRADNQRRFLTGDPQVCLVTQAAEQALNLQSARYIICINRIANPQRMIQVSGRIKRIKSPFQTVYSIDLVAQNTVEESMMHLLGQRAELFRTVFPQGGENPRLSSQDMLLLLQQDENREPRLIDA